MLKTFFQDQPLFKVSQVESRLFHQPLVIFDLEQTGGNPLNASVMEIAGLRFEKGQLVKSFHSYVRPEHSIPPFVHKLTQVPLDQVNQAPSWEEVFQDFWNFSQDAWFLSHGILGDLAFLRQAALQTSLNLESLWLCTQAMSERLLKKEKKTSLRFLSEKFAFPGAIHQATGDSLNTALLFRYLFQELHTNKGNSISVKDLILSALPALLLQRSEKIWNIQKKQFLSPQDLMKHQFAIVTYFSETREILGKFFTEHLFLKHCHFLADLSSKEGKVPFYIRIDPLQQMEVGFLRSWKEEEVYRSEHHSLKNRENSLLRVDLRAQKTFLRMGTKPQTHGWNFFIPKGFSRCQALAFYRRLMRLFATNVSSKKMRHQRIFTFLYSLVFLQEKEILLLWPFLNLKLLKQINQSHCLSLFPSGQLKIYDKMQTEMVNLTLINGFPQEGSVMPSLRDMTEPQLFWESKNLLMLTMQQTVQQFSGDTLCSFQRFSFNYQDFYSLLHEQKLVP